MAKKFDWDFVPVHLVPSKYKEYKNPKFLEKYTWEDEKGRVWDTHPHLFSFSVVNKLTYGRACALVNPYATSFPSRSNLKKGISVDHRHQDRYHKLTNPTNVIY